MRTDAAQLAAAPIAVHAGHDHRAARAGIPAHRLPCIRAPHCGPEIARIDTIRFPLVARIDRHASRRPSNPDLPMGSAGCDACAVRAPDGAVCATAAAVGSKPPDKAGPIAAVLIRFITPTQTCCRSYGLRLPRQRQLDQGPKTGAPHRVRGRLRSRCYKRTPCGIQPKRHR